MNNRSSVHAVRRLAQARPLPPAVRRARAALSDGARVERLSRTFRALGDPTRSKLVLALSLEQMCVSDLALALGTSLSATSHQLRILRDLDLVRVHRSGKTQVYTLNEYAFGFCAPSVCRAWRETLEGHAPRAPGTRGTRR